MLFSGISYFITSTSNQEGSISCLLFSSISSWITDVAEVLACAMTSYADISSGQDTSPTTYFLCKGLGFGYSFSIIQEIDDGV